MTRESAGRPAVLSDRPFALPLSAGDAGAQGVHASGRPARRGAQRHADPDRLPPLADDRLPAGLRELPRLRFGAGAGRRLPPQRQPAPRRCAPTPTSSARCGADKPSAEQYSLFRALSRRAPSRRRHGRHVGARLFDDGRGQPYRHAHRPNIAAAARHASPARRGPLVAACLTDRLADGLSLVYSFYDPDEAKRSLGAFMILDHIEKARRARPAARLSRLLGRGLAQDGLQGPPTCRRSASASNGWNRVERD